MIALTEARSSSCTNETNPPSFEDLLPAITKQARLAFRDLPGCEREELTAEVVANCFVAFTRLVERGMGDVIYPTPLAQFAIKQVRSGRRVGGKLNIRDVTSEYCRRAKGVKVERLDSLDDGDGEWREMLVEDRRATPAEVAATRIDFGSWLRTLKPRRRRIAKTLAGGESTSAAARQFRVSPARISQLRRELMESWEEFHGLYAANNKRECARSR